MYRLQLGLAFVHLVISPADVQTRQSAKETVEEQNRTHPSLVNQIVRDSLNVFLAKANKSTEDEQQSTSRLSHLISLLKACAAFDESTATSGRETLISQLILLAHHPKICA